MGKDAIRDNFDLSSEEHDRILDKIVSREFKKNNPTEPPRAIIIAGQPGCGKGGLAEEATQDFEQSPESYVLIDVDILRNYHPKYKDLNYDNDRTAAGLVQKDAGAWADELRRKATEERRNMVIDGTLKSPDRARESCKELKEAGYRVDVRVMAVSEDASKASIHGRYWHRKEKDGYGRWVPEHVHDEAYRGVPESISKLHESGAVDEISVYRRDPRGKTANDGHRPPEHLHTTNYRDGDETATDPKDVIIAERNRKPEPQEQAAWEDDWEKIIGQIMEHDKTLSEPENRRAFELAGRDAALTAERGSSEPRRSRSGSDDGIGGADSVVTETESRTEHRHKESTEWDKQEARESADLWPELDRGGPDVSRDSPVR